MYEYSELDTYLLILPKLNFSSTNKIVLEEVFEAGLFV